MYSRIRLQTRGRLLSTWSVALCLSMLGVFLAGPPAAAAAPACTASPTSGVVGTTITASCSGFKAGETVRVWWDVTTTLTAYATFTANSSGAGSASFKAPAAVRGAHSVIATGGTSGSKVTVPFTINPSATMSPTAGKTGSPTTFTLTGYAPNDTVTISWSHDGTTFTPLGTSFTTGTTGSASTFRTIPESTTGAHIVRFTATTTPTQNLTFTIQASLNLSATSAKVGSTVAATLHGYGANEAVNITWAGNMLGSLTTNQYGYGTASFLVPETPQGSYTVVAAGTAHSVSGTIGVVPSVSLSSTTGKVGSSVTVTLKGFAANTASSVNWYNDATTAVPLATTPAAITTNALGTASATVTVPDATNGSHNVEGAQGTTKATAAYTVGYDLVLTPTSGASGAAVTARLTGFKAGDAINLNWYVTTSSSSLLKALTAGANGSVTTTFNVPDGSSSGAHKVEAQNGGLARASLTFTVTAAAGGPACTLSKTAGPPSTSLTVNCTGFSGSEQVSVYLDSTVSTALATFTAASGAGSATVTIPADATAGAHAIVSKGQTSNGSAGATFTVTAAGGAGCAISAANGPVGATLNVSCSGFQPSEQIKVYWDSTSTTAVATVFANTSGIGSGSFKVPATTGGPHSVIARGATSALQSTQPFAVSPTMVLSPPSGKVNSTMTITLSGYAANETVTVGWSNDGTTFSPLGAPATTNATGGATITRPVPPAPFGPHSVQVAGVTTPAVTATYSVVAGLSLSTTQGKVGAALTATMQGYDPNEAIVVTFDGATAGTVTADATGNAVVSFAVPAAVKGAHAVAATGTAHSATASYTVLTTAALSATTGKVGATVTVTFTGYGAGDVIAVNWYKTTVNVVPLATDPGVVTADANGSATATFVVPEAVNGSHAVEGKAGGTVASAPFVVAFNETLTPAAGPAGTTVTLDLTGFSANASVTVRFWKTVSTYVDLATATTSADGTGSATFTVPAGTAAGQHKVACIVGGLERVTAQFTVQ